MIYSMSKRMYDLLVKGKVFASGRKVRGCGSKQGVIHYLNRTGGFLLPITDITTE